MASFGSSTRRRRSEHASSGPDHSCYGKARPRVQANPPTDSACRTFYGSTPQYTRDRGTIILTITSTTVTHDHTRSKSRRQRRSGARGSCVHSCLRRLCVSRGPHSRLMDVGILKIQILEMTNVKLSGVVGRFGFRGASLARAGSDPKSAARSMREIIAKRSTGLQANGGHKQLSAIPHRQ